MAKRLSSTQSNTLFNYFQSPKVKNTTTNSPRTPKTPKTDSKLAHEEDESPIHFKKRKISAIVDTDSDEENSLIKATPKKRKSVLKDKALSDNESSSSDEDNGGKSAKTPLKKYNFNKSLGGNESQNASSSQKKTSQNSNKGLVIGTVHSNWLHNRLEFLQPDKIRDLNRNRPDHPEYDSRTLYVPKDFLDKQTPAMRQWWVLKSTHMDSVLFFKVGKFYELYHMDAVVGVQELGFSYMKGEFAHSGFPETAYHKMANSLLERGFKVARTEQTETPEMMAERLKIRKGTKFDKVVNREICQISTKATCVYNAQLPEPMHALACYMYAITEKDVSSANRRFGICFIDTSIGIFHLAEFDDDKHCSRLLSVLSEYPPGLILKEKKKLSSKLKDILKTTYKDTRQDTLIPDTQFYSATGTIEKLLSRDYFKDKNNKTTLPQLLKEMSDGYNAKPEFELTLKALGACLWYLEDSKLDIQVVSLGKFQKYMPLSHTVQDTKGKSAMILDSVTMVNLNLLGGQGTLQKTIDHCHTAFGKRLLQQWICRPLCNVDKIKERQAAVQELYRNTGLLKGAQDVLKRLPDLERQLTKIHMYGNRFFAKNHPDSRAIFYEASTYSKRRINDLLKTLQGFELAQTIESIFKDCESEMLKRLTQFPPNGMYMDLSKTLTFFKDAFDQKQAQTEGKIIPKAGVDESYDSAEQAIEDVKTKLKVYLEEQQKFFGCKVTYFGSDKKRFQLDIPDTHNKKVTSEYQLEGTKKGAKPSKRYSTAYSKQLLAEMLKAESEQAKIVQDLNRRIFEKFSEKNDQWEQAVMCLTMLDVLCSFAEYARTFSQDICLPLVEPFTHSNNIVIEDGRHPCVSNVDSFVPNNTKLGVEDHASILLLTGPNMGGKSTLMRQVALISVMAQMGSYVPASKCQLNLIDRIFTRLGAHDDIIHGQSTFAVELAEASAILHHASPYSLILLDELGRGTSTHDGNAIATAYVKKLTHINCRTLFSTHYHSLVDHFVDRTDVQLGHMACMVENDEDPNKETVTFLYKMAKGRCPKSYGFNVARLAGLKPSIVSGGREIAKELEAENKNRQVTRDLFTNVCVSDIRKLVSLLKI